MSSFGQLSGGRRRGGALENSGKYGRSNFVRTCNLLSKYIKEKRSLGDLKFEIGGRIGRLQDIMMKPVSTHSAPPASATMETMISKAKSAEHFKEKKQPKTAQDFPMNTVADPSYKLRSKESTIPSPKAAQLTIFYSGRVLVFDDYPAEKARELVAFANKGSPQMLHGIPSDTGNEPTGWASGPGPREGLLPWLQPCDSSPNGSDLPIARRASIHRFLQKRKDRAAVRGPYRVPE